MALRIENQANPLWRFEIYHRRLLLTLAALGLVGWLAAVSALFYWLDRQPHNQVGWFDLAAPWRWTGLRAKRGDTAVLTALDELEARDYPSAFYNLRVGLSRSPGNVEGRLMLAQLTAGQDPVRAITMLEEGLSVAGDNPKLVGGLLGFYGTYQMHSHGLAKVENLLRSPARPLSPATRLLLERARVSFLLQLGRLAEAETAFAAITPTTDPVGQTSLAVLQSDLLLRRERPAEAKAVVDRLLAASPVGAGVRRLAAEVAIAQGDADALLSTLRHLKAETPNSPGAYLLAFQAWHRMKRPSLRDGAEQEYYRLFRASDGALQALAAMAVNLDLPDVVERAQRAATSARLSAFAFQVHRTELALRRGDTDEATKLLREWENNVDTLKAAQRFHPEFIKRLTRAAFAGTPDQVSFLIGHLTAARGLAQLPVYQLAATVLEKSGNPTGAAEVVRAGLQIYPQSEPLLVAQTRLAGLVTAVVASAEAPKSPSVSLGVLPVSADEVRLRLAELLQKDSLAGARDLIRALRAQKPSWLSTIENELAVREVELAYLTLDQIASRAAARAYLDRHRNELEVLDLVPVVQRLSARGQVGDARLLFDEIKGAPATSIRVQQALHELNFGDDTVPAMASLAALLAALDAQIRAQQWPQAERQLKQLRENPPVWLAAGASEVKVREVPIRLGLDQRPLALAALKDLVVKGGASRSAAFKLVRDSLARGEHESALLLAREIARLLPDEPAAVRLLREAETPPPVIP